MTPRTKYEFQVIGENEFGDGMYSAIIEAQTKGKYFDNEKNSKKTISHIITNIWIPLSANKSLDLEKI